MGELPSAQFLQKELYPVCGGGAAHRGVLYMLMTRVTADGKMIKLDNHGLISETSKLSIRQSLNQNLC